jgi:predicted  nucleic acid-binding Zn-ribbon protein
MSEEITQNIDGKRSFEERVFARFDALDSSVRDIEVRPKKLEARSYDTKPIWEQALKEIIDTRQELSGEIIQTRREISKRLDRIEAIAHETRADLRDAEDRIERLEPKPTQ